MTLGSGQPGKSTFDGAASKDYAAWINPSAIPVSNCNIWVPLCQTGSIVVDINVTTTTRRATEPCSHYLSAQSAFMEHVILDPSGWSTYDLYTSLWRSPECTSYAQYLQAKNPSQPLFASSRSTVSIPHLTYSDCGSNSSGTLLPPENYLPAKKYQRVEIAYPQQYCCGPCAMIIDEVKVLYFPEKSPAACSDIPCGPTKTGPEISDDLRKRFLIPGVLKPVEELLPTRTSASLKSASDRDLTPTISAAPADSGSPSLPVNTNGPHVKTSQPGPTASSRQTSSTSGHDLATGHVKPSPVHSEYQPSWKPSTNLGHPSQPPLNEPGQEPTNFFPANRSQQKHDSSKGSGEQPAHVSPVDPNDERVQVSSESQEHQQQTNRRNLEHQGSSISNFHGSVLYSLTSKALVIANATIRPSKSISSANTITSTSNITSISRSNTIAALRGLQSKTYVPKKLMIFGGCIIFALAYISF